MTEQTQFDRVLPGLFDEVAAARTPDYLEAAIERASSRTQRPAWTYPGRWLPMQITNEATVTARGPWRQLGVLALIGLLIALTVAYVGSRPTTPSPLLLARGSIDLKDWGPVGFEAIREGSTVTGRMTVGLEAGAHVDADKGFVTVDLQCALVTEDGVVLIGGYSTDGAGLMFRTHDEGTPFAIALGRGSPMSAPPMRAQIWAGTQDGVPATQGIDCLTYLDWWMRWMPTAGTHAGLSNVDGTVEFGP